MLFIISSNGFNSAYSCYISYIIHSRLAKCFLRQKLKAALYILIEFSLKANISLLASLKPTGLHGWQLIGADLKKKKKKLVVHHFIYGSIFDKGIICWSLYCVFKNLLCCDYSASLSVVEMHFKSTHYNDFWNVWE